MTDCELVRVHRRKHLDCYDGYVLAVGKRWLLLANLDGAIVLDGYTALRRRDVKSVRRKCTADFVRTALTLRGQWPPAPPATQVDLEGTRSLLASLRGQWPLVTVHPELEDPDVCFIGDLQHVGRKWMRLREITPQATWTEPPSEFRIDRITRVDMGGRYEQALIDVVRSDPTRTVRP